MKSLILSFFLILAPILAIADEPDESLHSKCLYPTVKINRSTGFIVRSIKTDNVYTNVVLTAAHVLSEPIVNVQVSKYKDWSVLDKNEEYKGYVYDKDNIRDIAILFFESADLLPTAELDFDAKFFIGSKLFKTGHGSNKVTLHRGEISATAEDVPDSPHNGCLRINAHTFYGDSGGPCFLASSYKVIGINKAIEQTPHGLPLPFYGFITPITAFKSWAEENHKIEFIYTDTPLPVTLSELKKAREIGDLKLKLTYIRDSLSKLQVAEEQLIQAIKQIDPNDKDIIEQKEVPPPIP